MKSSHLWLFFAIKVVVMGFFIYVFKKNFYSQYDFGQEPYTVLLFSALMLIFLISGLFNLYVAKIKEFSACLVSIPLISIALSFCIFWVVNYVFNSQTINDMVNILVLMSIIFYIMFQMFISLMLLIKETPLVFNNKVLLS